MNENKNLSKIIGSLEELCVGTDAAKLCVESLVNQFTETASALNQSVEVVKNINNASCKITESMYNLVEAMRKNLTDINSLVSTIEELERFFRKIEEVESFIEEASIKVKLFAINAKIEGCHYNIKSFGIFADEFKKIADNIYIQITPIKVVIKTMKEKIVEGKKKIHSLSTSFIQSDNECENVKIMTEEISAAINEESSTVSQISVSTKKELEDIVFIQDVIKDIDNLSSSINDLRCIVQKNEEKENKFAIYHKEIKNEDK